MPQPGNRYTDDDVQRLQDYALLISKLLHELRTPLGSIVGGASVLDQYGGKLDKPGKSRICAGMMDQAHRLDSLFTALAGVARARTGTLVRQPQVFELNELLRGLWTTDHNSSGSPRDIHLLREEVFLETDPAVIRLLVSTMLGLAVLSAPDPCNPSLFLVLEPETAVIKLHCGSREDVAARLDTLIDSGHHLAPSQIEARSDAISLAAIREVVDSLGGKFDIQRNEAEGLLYQTVRLMTCNASEPPSEF